MYTNLITEIDTRYLNEGQQLEACIQNLIPCKIYILNF